MRQKRHPLPLPKPPARSGPCTEPLSWWEQSWHTQGTAGSQRCPAVPKLSPTGCQHRSQGL